jgi:CBS domain-containing protein
MRVAELMTTNVLTVRRETSLKEVAGLLAARGISGAPVVDDGGRVVGVVSEADILAKERRLTAPTATGLARVLGRRPAQDAKASARTAGEAMTAPALTVRADTRVDAAAALMLDRGVNRLPVVDGAGRLAGIVTRADLVRAFVHSDEEIEREIRDEVLLHELWLDPAHFSLTVQAGEVTVAGDLPAGPERDLLAARIRLVPGVVSVTVHETAAA